MGDRMADNNIDSMDMDSDPSSERSLFLFGRDVSTIPCFRSSFLYGISIGMAVGFLAFLKTSRPQLSTHIGFGSFMATTVGYWIPCRYNWSKQKFDMSQMQRALQQQAIYEGTDKERELEAKTEEA